MLDKPRRPRMSDRVSHDLAQIAAWTRRSVEYRQVDTGVVYMERLAAWWLQKKDLEEIAAEQETTPEVGGGE